MSVPVSQAVKLLNVWKAVSRNTMCVCVCVVYREVGFCSTSSGATRLTFKNLYTKAVVDVEMEVEKFIEAVRLNEILWNLSNPNYKN